MTHAGVRGLEIMEFWAEIASDDLQIGGNLTAYAIETWTVVDDLQEGDESALDGEG